MSTEHEVTMVLGTKLAGDGATALKSMVKDAAEVAEQIKSNVIPVIGGLMEKIRDAIFVAINGQAFQKQRADQAPTLK